MHPLSRYIAFVEEYIAFESYIQLFEDIVRFKDVVNFTVEKSQQDTFKTSDSGNLYHHSYTYNNTYFSGLYVGTITEF